MLLSRRRRERQEKVQQEIRHALDLMRPILRIDECALTLASFDADTGKAVLDVKGGCPDCNLSVATFHEGIETQLKLRVPEVLSVSLQGNGKS